MIPPISPGAIDRLLSTAQSELTSALQIISSAGASPWEGQAASIYEAQRKPIVEALSLALDQLTTSWTLAGACARSDAVVKGGLSVVGR